MVSLLQAIISSYPAQHFGSQSSPTSYPQLGTQQQQQQLQETKTKTKTMAQTKEEEEEKEETRSQVIERLQKDHSILSLVLNDYAIYSGQARKLYESLSPGQRKGFDRAVMLGRYNHEMQLHTRQYFLQCLLGESGLVLDPALADAYWTTFVEGYVTLKDRDNAIQIVRNHNNMLLIRR